MRAAEPERRKWGIVFLTNGRCWRSVSQLPEFLPLSVEGRFRLYLAAEVVGVGEGTLGTSAVEIAARVKMLFDLLGWPRIQMAIDEIDLAYQVASARDADGKAGQSHLIEVEPTNPLWRAAAFDEVVVILRPTRRREDSRSSRFGADHGDQHANAHQAEKHNQGNDADDSTGGKAALGRRRGAANAPR